MPCIKSPGAAQLEQYTARRAHCFDAAEQTKVSVAVGTGNLPRTQIKICLGMDVLYSRSWCKVSMAKVYLPNLIH